jgi:hypothetical protein
VAWSLRPSWRPPAQAAPASAALSFTTVETLGQAGHEGKQQACKLLVTIGSDTYWKINNRLDGRTVAARHYVRLPRQHQDVARLAER